MDHDYSFNVNMYRDPPKGADTLMNAVDIACERLKLYQIIESKAYTSLDELKVLLQDSPFKLLLERTGPRSEKVLARRQDHISHWILRVAYAKHPDIFIRYEKEWFKLRFNCMRNIEKNKFMEKNNLVLTPVSKEDKDKLNIDMEDCYRVKFTEIYQLLPLRTFPLIDGYLYLPPEKIIYYIMNKFEEELKESLIYAYKVLPSMDYQLEGILSHLELVLPTFKYTSSSHSVSLENLDEEAATNFPLCMRFQHEILRRTHHLKYFSRMQYGLFLKGIGLSLERTLQLFQNEFTHDMPADRFLKKYSYLFKHQYGTVGSRIDHSPYSCETIFEKGTDVHRIHGCPYMLWTEDKLKKKLEEYKLKPRDIEGIVNLAKENKFTEACTKYFECYHACKLNETITHPNEYFQKSCQFTRSRLPDIEDLFLPDSPSPLK